MPLKETAAVFFLTSASVSRSFSEIMNIVQMRSNAAHIDFAGKELRLSLRLEEH